ncbi:hypothetical protein JTB14_001993 [Gonioctena quinquepunctata]|nr:hypothetical protein JTB14_001993 [Gonioctena quinquepunctata]
MGNFWEGEKGEPAPASPGSFPQRQKNPKGHWETAKTPKPPGFKKISRGGRGPSYTGFKGRKGNPTPDAGRKGEKGFAFGRMNFAVPGEKAKFWKPREVKRGPPKPGAQPRTFPCKIKKTHGDVQKTNSPLPPVFFLLPRNFKRAPEKKGEKGGPRPTPKFRG